jgi:Fe-S oxidoreductase
MDIMKATEAKKISNANKYKVAARFKEIEKLEIARKREKADRVKEEIKKYYQSCKTEILCLSQDGYSEATVSVFSDYGYDESKKVGKKVAELLQKDGYKVEVFNNMIATGVDEWEDRCEIRIRW